MNTSGYILTNAHVLQDANDIRITLNDGRQSQAQLIGLDADTDLAVINISITKPAHDSHWRLIQLTSRRYRACHRQSL